LCNYRKLSDCIKGTKFSYRGYSNLISIFHKVIKNSDDSEIKNSIVIAFVESNFFRILEQEYLTGLIEKTKAHEFSLRLKDLDKVIDILNICTDQFRSRVSEFPIGPLKTFINDGDLSMMEDIYDVAKV
jgi:hypothetical protein